MAVKLLFPSYIFHRNFTQEGLPEDRGFSKEYCLMLRDEMDAMRRRDPIGRQLSNQYTGWQSHDGCERNPMYAIFSKSRCFETTNMVRELSENCQRTIRESLIII